MTLELHNCAPVSSEVKKMKRQRVSLACQKCRALKAKCDGQQPSCSRCVGYGFTCSWSQRDIKEDSTEATSQRASRGRVASSPTVAESPGKTGDLGRVADLYEALIQSVRPKLDGAERASVDMTVEHIRKQIPGSVQDGDRFNGLASSRTRSVRQPSFQGSASDLEFLNTVRDFIQEQENTFPTKEQDSHSYDQSDRAVIVPTFERPLRFPPRRLASSYLEIYFSTIHVAYPYLYRPIIMHHLSSVLKDESGEVDEKPWLGLLNALFAIGAYYMSFPRSEAEDAPSHSQYFEQSVFFSNQVTSNCTLTSVWILLVQCFYLLATCHIDRCWNTLGLAVRMGQSIGLHVENSRVKNTELAESLERELRRRTWYSLYVLDRLLSLQLGRPVAIHEEDFSVSLPSRVEDLTSDEAFAITNHGRDQSTGDLSQPPVQETQPEALYGIHIPGDGVHQEPSYVDYFLRVIQFSHILGQVIKELYRPAQMEAPPEAMLLSTSILDMSLSRWKCELPRHLRFDLGHTFEKSITFKRQRNMLAVKYHHLRALVHRPFLCLQYLKRSNRPFMDLLQGARSEIARAERICVSEAQSTAHLLHHVEDERSLVHDFPWWQMIPCLICASSILIVAGAFWKESSSLSDLPCTFHDDAETCLKVFDALSANSDAARRATDLLKGVTRLKRCSMDTSIAPRASMDLSVDTGWLISPTSPIGDSSLSFPPNSDVSADRSGWQWPSEISNTMEWSAQFLPSNMHQVTSALNPGEAGTGTKDDGYGR